MGYIGVFLGDISEERARELQLNEVRGAVVGKVEDDSPAVRAGLIENDVILAFNDQMIQNRSQLYRLIINSSPGAKATLTISRKGSLRTLSIELGQRRVGIQDERKRLYGEADAMLAAAEDRRREAEVLRLSGDTAGAQKLIEEEQLFRKQSEERRTYVEEQLRQGKIKENTGIQRPTYSISANRYSLGLTAVPIGEQLAQYFNTGESGVLVSEVRAGGAAEKVGIKAGDCIVAVNDEKVRSVSDLFRLVDRQGSTETVSEKSEAEVILTIIRDRNERKIKVDLESR
ncbi:MAG: PDZ domain-containing protein [Acidobacteria bacterium]|nr:PDZ domain-containing protein [Acidobacteriota bacterium]